MSLIPALVQELLKISVGGHKRPPGWNRLSDNAKIAMVRLGID